MSSLPSPYLTPEQYLDAERQSERRSEYVEGQMYMMAGTSKEHARILFNLIAALHGQLKGSNCRGFATDMRVRARLGGPYYYPDLAVVCGQQQFEDANSDTLLNPK